MIGIEWENVNLVGAFLVGTLFGTIATLRIVRYVTNFFRGGEGQPGARD